MGDETNTSSLQTLQLEPEQLNAPRLLRTAAAPAQPGVLDDIIAPAQAPSADELPILDETPAQAGDLFWVGDSTAYFVPAAVIPARSAKSRTPAVFLKPDDDVAEAWRLVVWLDLVRPEGVPPEATPLPLTDFAGEFTSALAGAGAAFTATELAPPDPSVLHRIALAARVDPARAADALRSDPAAAVTVTAAAHHARYAGVDEQERERRTREAVRIIMFTDNFTEQVEPPPTPEQLEMYRTMHLQRLQKIVSLLSGLPWMDDEGRQVLAAAGTDMQEVEIITLDIINRQAAAPPGNAAVRTTVRLGPGGAPVSLFLPVSNRPNQAIYLPWNRRLGDLTGGVDPDSAWLDTGEGMWQASPVPNEYNVLPNEYRLAFDAERGTPAMSVLLVQAAGTAGAAPQWKVRVRFRLLPWLDPVALERLRRQVADVEGCAYPELVVGNLGGATFDVSSWLSDLGGDTVAAQGGTLEVDPRGFELVLDCSMEFYTLLARLLAPGPGGGTGSGVEGRVVFSLRTSRDDGAVSRREVPVRIRLDQPDDGFLVAEQVDAAFPDPSACPPSWTPSLYCKVRAPAGVHADIGGVVATMLVLDPATGLPAESAPATVEPAAFTVGGDPSLVRVPQPDPPQQVPQAGPGEVLLRLRPQPAAAVDPRQVGLLAVDFTGVKVHLEPAAVLERVHELGTSTGLVTSVDISCYLLKHPESLPPALADMYGVDVEIRSGGADPITVTLDRDRPEGTAAVPFGFADLVRGGRPDQPRFEYRRRNLRPQGAGEYSPWQPFSGRSLHVTPVA